MQNLIRSVFKTMNTVEEGVWLLDIFRPMSTREVSVSQTHTQTHKVNLSWTHLPKTPDFFSLYVQYEQKKNISSKTVILLHTVNIVV